jgi:hypothetical protein
MKFIELQRSKGLFKIRMSQIARMLHHNKLEKLARDKHSSLSGPFVSCEENEVL